MNAKARTARQIIRNRKADARSAKRPHTLAGHCRIAGLDAADASGVAGALRAKGKTLGVTGCPVRMFRRNAAGQKLWKQPVKNARRFTTDEFAEIAAAYNPRAARYVTARATLLAYVG